MHSFKDFNITTQSKPFTGEKISLERVLNKEIIVQDYKVEDSKYEGQRLTLQVEVERQQRVIFTGSTVLQELIEKVPKDKFPFTTTIIKENKRFEFT